MELTKNEIINNVVDELDRAVDMLESISDSESLNLYARQELVSDIEADKERLIMLLDNEPEYELISLEDFKNLKPYDEIIVKINNEFVKTTCLDSSFYNCDADEPDWEVETPIGFICWDSAYVPEECSYSIEEQFIKWVENTDRSFVIAEGKMRYRFIQERVGRAKLVYRVSEMHYDVRNSTQVIAVVTDECIYVCNQNKLKFNVTDYEEMKLLSDYQQELGKKLREVYIPDFLDLRDKKSSTNPNDIRKKARKLAFKKNDSVKKTPKFITPQDCIVILCGLITEERKALDLFNANKYSIENEALDEEIINRLTSSIDFIAPWEWRLYDSLIRLEDVAVELELCTLNITARVDHVIESLINESYLPSTKIKCKLITKVKAGEKIIYEL